MRTNSVSYHYDELASHNYKKDLIIMTFEVFSHEVSMNLSHLIITHN